MAMLDNTIGRKWSYFAIEVAEQQNTDRAEAENQAQDKLQDSNLPKPYLQTWTTLCWKKMKNH